MHFLRNSGFLPAVLAAAIFGGTVAHAQQPAAERVAGVHPTAASVAGAEKAAATQQVGIAPDQAFDDADLWQRVRRGFVMGELNSPLVQEQENWYASRPDYIQRFVDRGSRYLYHVVQEVEQRGMPTEVALLPVIESAFNPQAYSRAKAAGMWQFIPSTGKNFGLKQDWHLDNRRDVLLSTHAALDYLQKLYGMFNSWELAFAAYNCGEGCVARAIQKNQKKGLPTDYLSLPLPPETRSYVPKLIAVKNIVLSPGTYGIELVAVENRPYFAKVAAPDKMDVKLAARLAELPEEEFAALNPASSRPVAASATGSFLVPADKADLFRENLEIYRSLNGPMVSWTNASAKRGESVSAVAQRYGMTPSYLRATAGPFKEKNGKLSQPITFMVPSQKQAQMIAATLEKKTAIRAAQAVAAPAAGEGEPVPSSAPVQLASNSTDLPSAAAGQAETPAAPAPAVIPVNVAPQQIASVRTAAAPVAAPQPARTTTYRVQRGDTLFAVARKFDTSIEELQRLNGIKGGALQVGQSLKVGNATEAPTLIKVAQPAQLSIAKPAAGKATHYVIRPGDTLFAIANKFSVELNDLMRWNRLTARSVIQPGSKIRVSA